jgi:hypothetical protein
MRSRSTIHGGELVAVVRLAQQLTGRAQDRCRGLGNAGGHDRASERSQAIRYEGGRSFILSKRVNGGMDKKEMEQTTALVFSK